MRFCQTVKFDWLAKYVRNRKSSNRVFREGWVELPGSLQRYLAHKKQPPP